MTADVIPAGADAAPIVEPPDPLAVVSAETIDNEDGRHARRTFGSGVVETLLTEPSQAWLDTRAQEATAMAAAAPPSDADKIAAMMRDVAALVPSGETAALLTAKT